jgi:hypothetical protein
VALFILPNPGGGIPASVAALYRNSTPLNLPLAFYVIAMLLSIWLYLSSTRYGKFLYAVGGKADAAYETAVPVTRVQFSTYILSGLMAALSGIAITMLSGSGNADIGAPMTLNSITAVVIGGNALSGFKTLSPSPISIRGGKRWSEPQSSLWPWLRLVLLICSAGEDDEANFYLSTGCRTAFGRSIVLVIRSIAQRVWQ